MAKKNNNQTEGFTPTVEQEVDNAAMVVVEPEPETRSPFILGNTKEIGLTELGDMLTPVVSRDNVETISHTEVINTVFDAVSTFFDGQEISAPVVRVSHEMKLRNRFGMGKLVENLKPEDSDSYFQRMMAMIEIPSISHDINGSRCNLQVCIVRNYADCNLLGNSSQKQSIKLGIGFLNTVCTNGLLNCDSVNLAIKVTNTADFYKYCIELFKQYDYKRHLDDMRRLNDTVVTVSTLAQFLGRARMAAALPTSMKNELGLPEFILPEAQLNNMIRDYYTDENFGGFGREITAWQFYMLLTNYKNNYIDVTLERSVNSFQISKGVAAAINHDDDTWAWFIE